MVHKKWCSMPVSLSDLLALYFFNFCFLLLYIFFLNLLGYLCWIFCSSTNTVREKAMSPLSFRFRLMGWSKWTNQASRFDPCVFCRPVVSRIVMAIGHGSKSSQKKSFKRGFSKNLTLSEYFFPNNGENHSVWSGMKRPFARISFSQSRDRGSLCDLEDFADSFFSARYEAHPKSRMLLLLLWWWWWWLVEVWSSFFTSLPWCSPK